MTIKVQVTRRAGTEDLELPAYQSEHASGMDLLAAVDKPLEIAAGKRALVPTGLFIAVPPGYEAQVRARSGLTLKKGICVLNGPGTVDADYRGEVGVILANLGDEPFTVERGMRVAQLVICPVVKAEWEQVKELPSTDRGAGGFGSSGVHGK
ncbi:MAG TPA: dUTP diphosphatase [Planctomycetota bacterium]|nr:dUTP diphosphatase [Planctomycetota bacterium]